ncbi:hypothetical protein J2Y46_000932 [Microbacterium sp. BE35]|nr:hypothetical protein [Microbacterium sp. BE35]MDR7188116.1 hypothetical protein [Microbacterium sp. BE35]
MDNKGLNVSVAWKLDDFLHFMGGPVEAPSVVEQMCRASADRQRE